MTKKVENMTKHRQKKKPQSIEAVAKVAARRFLDNAPNVDEPKHFASGNMKEFMEGSKAAEDKDGEDDRG